VYRLSVHGLLKNDSEEMIPVWRQKIKCEDNIKEDLHETSVRLCIRFNSVMIGFMGYSCKDVNGPLKFPGKI
jgi:hypothetical protein